MAGTQRFFLPAAIAVFTFLRSAFDVCGAQDEAVTREKFPGGFNLIHGAVNGAFIERDGKFLAVYGDPSGHEPTPEIVLLAEVRRDVTWSTPGLVQRGTRVIAPEKEAGFLTQPDKFWTGLRDARFHDYSQQSTKEPVEKVSVSRTVKGGDTVEWNGLSIRVLDTPGYTRGAVSYVAQLEGQKVAFTGDLIRDDGKLQDLFSLQDGIPEAKIGGYHGWAGRLGLLMASLDRIAAEKPDLLIPLRGPAIRNPLAAIKRLQDRIRAVYSNYLSIDALRWYFKDEHIVAKARLVLGQEASQSSDLIPRLLPMAETLPLPPEIVAISNSRLLLSSDGSGFLVDCGGKDIIEELRKLRAAGKLKSIEHVFVTHYHDDHTDALNTVVEEFGAKIHACGSLIDLLKRPGDYRLPCLTRNPVKVTAKHQDGDSWKWKEYRLTIFDFPGQTLHHNALLVAGGHNWSAFFAGDSFTPSGVDDYCLQNRNFLHAGQGFFRCLDLLGKLPPGCLLINQHVYPVFRFSPPQVLRMRDTLSQRVGLLTALLPFDDPNFGLDENWAVLHPYWVTVRAGATVPLEVRFTNHSARKQTFHAVVHAPESWELSTAGPARIAPREVGIVHASLDVPRNAAPGLHVVLADVGWAGTDLREWAEAVVEVVP